MYWPKRILAVSLVGLWLLPSLLVWVHALHVALDHPGERWSDHSHVATTLAEAVFHGHHHEKAEAADHSHDVTLTTSKHVERRHLEVATTMATMTVRAASPPATQVATSVPRRGPPTPLFTAHCSLLL